MVSTWLIIAAVAAVIVVAAVLTLIYPAVRIALNSLREEHAEIAADPRARSEAWSRMGPQVIAAEERRRQAGVLRGLADAGMPVAGPDGVELSVEQLRFAAELIDKEGTL